MVLVVADVPMYVPKVEGEAVMLVPKRVPPLVMINAAPDPFMVRLAVLVIIPPLTVNVPPLTVVAPV